MIRLPLLGLVTLLALLGACDNSPPLSGPDGQGVPPETFVNGFEGRVWWPNPAQPANARVRGEFRAATAWLSMVDDQRVNDGSVIEVDYLRLYARAQGTDHLVASDEYNVGDVPGGGLYNRNDWFEGAQRAQIRHHSSIQNGLLLLPVEQCPDCVWHVWVEDYPRPLLPAGTERVWVETRFRIVGKAVLQLGFDYNRGAADTGCDIDFDGRQDVGECEAGKSHWQFPASTGDGWQVLVLR